jgi:hypothetical protein
MEVPPLHAARKANDSNNPTNFFFSQPVLRTLATYDVTATVLSRSLARWRLAHCGLDYLAGV